MKFSRILGAAVVVVAVLIAMNTHAHHAQYYVLDGFGGVHAGGGAPAAPAGIPYFGFDIAKDIAYVPTSAPGPGVLVLDGFGGVHSGGLGIVSPATPYFGFDVARAIVYRNVAPRAVGATTDGGGDRNDNAAFVVESLTITAPDDGFLVVTGNIQFNCPDYMTAGGVVGRVWLNVDSTALDADFSEHYAVLPCSGLVQNYFYAENMSPHKVYPVAAGPHTVNLVIQRTAGTKSFRWLDPHLSAVFIDLGATGTSAPEVAFPGLSPSRRQ